jgi:fructosamine-3-kinase
MLTASIQKYLNQLLAESVGIQISSLNLRSIGGGCINETYQVRINGNIDFFLKANSATKYPGLFETEMLGLKFLGRQKEIRVPSVVAFREVESHQILLLEWINTGVKTKEFWARFGEQLAALHRVTDPHFGFTQDNYIGSLPQINEQHQNWTDFFHSLPASSAIKVGQGEKPYSSKTYWGLRKTLRTPAWHFWPGKDCTSPRRSVEWEFYV